MWKSKVVVFLKFVVSNIRAPQFEDNAIRLLSSEKETLSFLRMSSVAISLVIILFQTCTDSSDMSRTNLSSGGVIDVSHGLRRWLDTSSTGTTEVPELDIPRRPGDDGIVIAGKKLDTRHSVRVVPFRMGRRVPEDQRCDLRSTPTTCHLGRK
jgi:hypothetical protein